jgi:hypothetical protein
MMAEGRGPRPLGGGLSNGGFRTDFKGNSRHNSGEGNTSLPDHAFMRADFLGLTQPRKNKRVY